VRLGWVATAGLVCVGLAGVLAWTHVDTARRLARGDYQRVDFTVVSAVRAPGDGRLGLLTVRFQDPDGGGQREGTALISAAEAKDGTYREGQAVQGWVHPGMERPVVADARPSHAASQSFTLAAAAVCATLGFGLLALAGAKGWIVVP